MPLSDSPALQRFVDAQTSVYPQVHAELSAGHKRTHWMWFIFPQLRGLGSSPTAQHFSLASLDEARAFLAHPVLGPRLQDCTSLVLRHPHRSVEDIFPFPDNLKFHSSVTLFDRAGTPHDGSSVFHAALATFFAGNPDQATLRLLGTAS